MNRDLRILIVEDDILIATSTQEFLNDEGYTTIALAHDFEKALSVSESFRPNTILLDLNLKGALRGIELAKRFDRKVKIIFITAQSDLQTIKTAAKLNPIAYLTKPFKEVDILAALQIVEQQLRSNHIVVRCGYEDVKVDFADILFLKSDNIYVDIFTESKKYSIRKSLNTVQSELPDDVFIKVHRSYLVNINKINRKSTKILYINDFQIPVSRNFNFNKQL